MTYTKEQRLINSISGSTKQQRNENVQTNETGSFNIPNKSGDHVKSIKREAPVNDFDLVNKKYVDDNDSDTTYSAGTSLTLVGTTFNVDDDFLKNTGDTGSGDYTFSGDITANGLSSSPLQVNSSGTTYSFGSQFLDVVNGYMQLTETDSYNTIVRTLAIYKHTLTGTNAGVGLGAAFDFYLPYNGQTAGQSVIAGGLTCKWEDAAFTTTSASFGFSAKSKSVLIDVMKVSGKNKALEMDDYFKVSLGTSQDCYITYDGTDMRLKPDAVGNGKFINEGAYRIDDKTAPLSIGLGTQGSATNYAEKKFITTFQTTSSATNNSDVYILSADESIIVRAKVTGIKSDGSLAYGGEFSRLIRKDGGSNAVTVGTLKTIWSETSEISPTVNITTSTNSLRVSLSAPTATTINWTVVTEVVSSI